MGAMEILEDTPPNDLLHRQLWAMGLTAPEREKVIAVGLAHVNAGLIDGPIELAQAIVHMRSPSIRELGIISRTVAGEIRSVDRILGAVHNFIVRIAILFGHLYSRATRWLS